MLINTDVELGPLPPTRVLDRHLPTGIALHGYNAEDMRAYGAQERAAERERLLGAMLSTPNLMHACDALGVPANVEYCDLLRRALYRA